MVKIGIFVAGFFTVAQFSFWGNYIPLVFPAAPARHRRELRRQHRRPRHRHGRGVDHADVLGSRPPDPAKIAMVGAAVAGIYALIGAIATQWLPEPPSDAVAKEGR